MAWRSLGQILVVTPGTRVRLTVNRPVPTDTLMCQSLLVQAIASPGHVNTGRAYVYDVPTGGAPMATLAVPTANTIPAASVTVPNAPAALDATPYWIDVDVGGDGVNASYLVL